MIATVRRWARQASDWLVRRPITLILLVAIGVNWFGPRPVRKEIAIIAVPEVLVVIACVVVIIAALAMVGIDVYKVRVFASDWDRTRDDADRGARAADHLPDMADALEELSGVVVQLAEQLEADAAAAALADAPTGPVEPLPPDTVTAHPAASQTVQAEALDRRPTPYPRTTARTYGRHSA